jgi:hypothetical protein
MLIIVLAIAAWTAILALALAAAAAAARGDAVVADSVEATPREDLYQGILVLDPAAAISA